MAAQATKRQILEDSGYTYSFDREIYFNRCTKKAFSVEFVEDHSQDVLQKCISEDGQGGRWRFYFNFPPSESVSRDLESALS